MTTFSALAEGFRSALPAVDFCSLRLSRETHQRLTVRQGVLEPIESWDDRGAMIVVHHGGGAGYAATGDLSPSGIAAAVDQARQWAERT